MQSPEKLKKYQKEKFDSYKKVNELKIDDDEAYIDVKVGNLSDIVSEYSISSKPRLKDEFYDYIEQSASFIPLDYPLVLEIHNKTFSAEEKILVRRLIRNHFKLKTITKEMELKIIKRKMYFFLISGIIGFTILAFSYGLGHVLIGEFLREIILFLASFSIWEYAEMHVFEQDQINEEIIMNKHLSTIRVVYDKEIS